MWLWLWEGNLKKNVQKGGRFFHHLLFGSIKQVYFFKNTNALIFELFCKVFGEVPFLKSPWAFPCSFCLEMLWGERSNLGNTQKKKLFFFQATFSKYNFLDFFPPEGYPNPLAEFVCRKNCSIEGGEGYKWTIKWAKNSVFGPTNTCCLGRKSD